MFNRWGLQCARMITTTACNLEGKPFIGEYGDDSGRVKWWWWWCLLMLMLDCRSSSRSSLATLATGPSSLMGLSVNEEERLSRNPSTNTRWVLMVAMVQFFGNIIVLLFWKDRSQGCVCVFQNCQIDWILIPHSRAIEYKYLHFTIDRGIG